MADFTHKCVVIDLDGTISNGRGKAEHGYRDADTHEDVIAILHAWQAEGWQLLLDTARGQTRFGKNGFGARTSLWLKHIKSEVLDWLNDNTLGHLFDKVQLGKKLFGRAYVDDKALPVDLLRQAHQFDPAQAKAMSPDEYLKFFKTPQFAEAVAYWMEQNAKDNICK